MTTGCTHLEQIQDVTPSADGCEDCLKIGDRWVHLRECLICGHVCYDASKNKHAANIFLRPRGMRETQSPRVLRVSK